MKDVFGDPYAALYYVHFLIKNIAAVAISCHTKYNFSKSILTDFNYQPMLEKKIGDVALANKITKLYKKVYPFGTILI